jgi:hypothetical protein
MIYMISLLLLKMLKLMRKELLYFLPCFYFSERKWGHRLLVSSLLVYCVTHNRHLVNICGINSLWITGNA